MIELLRGRFAFQLAYVNELVVDVPDDRFADQPLPGLNSPAWLLGHLCWAADLIPALLGDAPAVDRAWAARFGNRSRPKADRHRYPPKDDLIAALNAAHARAELALPRITPEALAAEMPEPAYRSFIPTVGDAIVHLLTSHEAAHAGQLSAWRRAAGLPPAKMLSFA